MTLDAKTYVKALREGTREFFAELGTAEQVKASVKKELDERKEAIFARILGFDTKWGRSWEVDHCNGRQTGVDDALAKHVRAAATEWVDTVVAEHRRGPPVSLQAGIVKDFDAQVKRLVQREMHDAARSAAREVCNVLTARATNDVDEILETIESLVELEQTEIE